MGERAEVMVGAEEREVLERWARRPSSAQALAFRCRVVLAAAEGRSSTEIAAELGCARSTVGRWRGRFARRGLDGLHDEPRPGKPRSISDQDVERVIVKTLEERPRNATHWSTRSMAAATGMSQSAVSRIWRAFGLKPQQTEAFKLSPDPQFIDKVRDIVGLYLNPPEAAVVLCVDEKSQIQALDRSAPVLPLLPGVPERRSHDDVRYGTTNLYAALDVASGQVLSEMTPRHRADEFRRFLNRIDAAVPAGLDVHDLVAWKRRGAAALLRPACRGLHPRWDRVLFVRQARGRRVGGEVLPRCLRSLQPRHSGRGGCRRRHPPTARDRPGPGRLPRSERSRMGCAAGSGDLEARRVRRDRQPWCPPTQRRRELRALRWRKREHQATPVRGCDRVEGQ
jgi:transposase